jgi:hypothetical protein
MEKMHAAVVTSFGSPPHYQQFDVPKPTTEHEILVDVLAVGLHPRTRSGAAETHYTSTGARQTSISPSCLHSLTKWTLAPSALSPGLYPWQMSRRSGSAQTCQANERCSYRRAQRERWQACHSGWN